MKMNAKFTKPQFLCLALVCALALEFGLPESARAAAVADVTVRPTADGDEDDAMTVLAGTALAGLSGMAVFGSHATTYEANATANTNSGSLRAATTLITQGQRSNGLAAAGASVFDDLEFFGDGEVEITLVMIGGFTHIGGPTLFKAQADLQLVGFGSSSVQVTYDKSQFGNGKVDYFTSSATLLGNPDEPSLVRATLTVRALVHTGTKAMLSAQLNLLTASGANSDASSHFDHTAQLAINLPEGVSFTSASGAFLSVPVPVPASLTSLALGGVVLATRRRRRPGPSGA